MRTRTTRIVLTASVIVASFGAFGPLHSQAELEDGCSSGKKDCGLGIRCTKWEGEVCVKNEIYERTMPTKGE
jgi:hypothetical protein